MEFEDILSQVGGYGKYQKHLTIFFLIPVSCILALIEMNGLFIVSIPEHWCHVEDVVNSNLSISKQRTLVSPPADPSCSMYDVNYTDYLDRNFTFSNNTNIVPCTAGWQYDKRDYDSTASTKWNLVCDHRYFPSFVLSLQNVGSLLFTPIYGFLADRFGRKRVYLVLAAISSATEIASVTVEDFTAFAVLRTIHGGVFPSMFTLALILIIEIVAPEMRAHMNGIINYFWTMGLCLLPLIAYLSGNWINLGLVCSLACGCNLLYCRYIPESPSWLVSRGRYEEATTIMEQMGKKNGKPQDRAHLFKQLQTLGLSIQRKKETEKGSSSYHLLKYPRIRRHFMILSFCWTSFYMSYFGIMYNLRNLTGNEFLNFFLLSIVEIPGNILFWILMDRAGRRWTSSIGFILVGIVSLGPLTGFQYSDIIFSTISKFFSTGLLMVPDQQGTELFPTVARSFAMGLGKTLSNAVFLLVPFFADLGEYGKELPYIVMGCISLVAGILASFLPETLNENLPQTISDAEEFGRDQKFFSWIRRKTPISTNESSTPDLTTWSLTTDESLPVSASDPTSNSKTGIETENGEATKLCDQPVAESSAYSKAPKPRDTIKK